MLREIRRAKAWFGLEILLLHQCVTGIHWRLDNMLVFRLHKGAVSSRYVRWKFIHGVNSDKIITFLPRVTFWELAQCFFLSHGQQLEMKGLFLKHELNDNVCITRCFCSSKNCLMEFFYFKMKQERNLQLPSFPKWKGLVMATATTRKIVFRASPENEHLYNRNHFAFTSSCLYLAMLLELRCNWTTRRIVQSIMESLRFTAQGVVKL